jgi:hypothetical protein
MVIARIPDHIPDATLRTIHTAHQAEAAGYEHVQTGYDPAHATYTVTADPPGQAHARHVIDGYLGR